MVTAPLLQGKLSAPASLTAQHLLSNFNCGEDKLNRWLQTNALQNQGSGASRTFVICDDLGVAGFYALATGAVGRDQATKNVARNMPDPIPVLIIARLAVDLRLQGNGIGGSLLQDALKRCLQISEMVGVRAVLLHAKNDRAASFYQGYGFKPSPFDDLMMMVTIKQINASL